MGIFNFSKSRRTKKKKSNNSNDNNNNNHNHNKNLPWDALIEKKNDPTHDNNGGMNRIASNNSIISCLLSSNHSTNNNNNNNNNTNGSMNQKNHHSYFTQSIDTSTAAVVSNRQQQTPNTNLITTKSKLIETTVTENNMLSMNNKNKKNNKSTRSLFSARFRGGTTRSAGGGINSIIQYLKRMASDVEQYDAQLQQQRTNNNNNAEQTDTSSSTAAFDVVVGGGVVTQEGAGAASVSASALPMNEIFHEQGKKDSKTIKSRSRKTRNGNHHNHHHHRGPFNETNWMNGIDDDDDDDNNGVVDDDSEKDSSSSLDDDEDEDEVVEDEDESHDETSMEGDDDDDDDDDESDDDDDENDDDKVKDDFDFGDIFPDYVPWGRPVPLPSASTKKMMQTNKTTATSTSSTTTRSIPKSKRQQIVHRNDEQKIGTSSISGAVVYGSNSSTNSGSHSSNSSSSSCSSSSHNASTTVLVPTEDDDVSTISKVSTIAAVSTTTTTTITGTPSSVASCEKEKKNPFSHYYQEYDTTILRNNVQRKNKNKLHTVSSNSQRHKQQRQQQQQQQQHKHQQQQRSKGGGGGRTQTKNGTSIPSKIEIENFANTKNLLLNHHHLNVSSHSADRVNHNNSNNNNNNHINHNMKERLDHASALQNTITAATIESQLLRTENTQYNSHHAQGSMMERQLGNTLLNSTSATTNTSNANDKNHDATIATTNMMDPLLSHNPSDMYLAILANEVRKMQSTMYGSNPTLPLSSDHHQQQLQQQRDFFMDTLNTGSTHGNSNSNGNHNTNTNNTTTITTKNHMNNSNNNDTTHEMGTRHFGSVPNDSLSRNRDANSCKRSSTDHSTVATPLVLVHDVQQVQNSQHNNNSSSMDHYSYAAAIAATSTFYNNHGYLPNHTGGGSGGGFYQHGISPYIGSYNTAYLNGLSQLPPLTQENTLFHLAELRNQQQLYPPTDSHILQQQHIHHLSHIGIVPSTTATAAAAKTNGVGSMDPDFRASRNSLQAAHELDMSTPRVRNNIDNYTNTNTNPMNFNHYLLGNNPNQLHQQQQRLPGKYVSLLDEIQVYEEMEALQQLHQYSNNNKNNSSNIGQIKPTLGQQQQETMHQREEKIINPEVTQNLNNSGTKPSTEILRADGTSASVCNGTSGDNNEPVERTTYKDKVEMKSDGLDLSNSTECLPIDQNVSVPSSVPLLPTNDKDPDSDSSKDEKAVPFPLPAGYRSTILHNENHVKEGKTEAAHSGTNGIQNSNTIQPNTLKVDSMRVGYELPLPVPLRNVNDDATNPTETSRYTMKQNLQANLIGAGAIETTQNMYGSGLVPGVQVPNYQSMNLYRQPGHGIHDTVPFGQPVSSEQMTDQQFQFYQYQLHRQNAIQNQILREQLQERQYMNTMGPNPSGRGARSTMHPQDRFLPLQYQVGYDSSGNLNMLQHHPDHHPSHFGMPVNPQISQRNLEQDQNGYGAYLRRNAAFGPSHLFGQAPLERQEPSTFPLSQSVAQVERNILQKEMNGVQPFYEQEREQETISRSSTNNISTQSQIEFSPGVFGKLRTISETVHAYELGYVSFTACIICKVDLVCLNDAEYVLCPSCRKVSPVIDKTNNVEQRRKRIGGGICVGMLASDFP